VFECSRGVHAKVQLSVESLRHEFKHGESVVKLLQHVLHAAFTLLVIQALQLLDVTASRSNEGVGRIDSE